MVWWGAAMSRAGVLWRRVPQTRGPDSPPGSWPGSSFAEPGFSDDPSPSQAVCNDRPS